MHQRNRREQLGPVTQKILLLLNAGLSLSLSYGPARYSRVVKDAAREWQKINQQGLKRAIARLYQSKMVDYKENEDGTVSIILNESGKKRALRYSLDAITVKKPKHWDGLWRVVIFDIPEGLKRGRDALAEKLVQLGFRHLQKSVFIFPYECRDEVDFVVEVFGLRRYVRFLLVKKTDIDLDLRHHFRLRR
ncbi:hypothetical protein HY504_00410 [Candidatus Wolfebacteria bacterium]|nr:hypothetical protein [Candidatus Wolfebacteria bacterium]